MSYQDKTLTCQDCGQEFIFSADDQQYHAEKGYANEPKRCPTCRSNRRSGGGGYGGGGGGYGGGGAAGAKCTQPSARSVAKTHRCRSAPAATGPSTAATASASSHPQDAATNRTQQIMTQGARMGPLLAS